MKESRNKNKKHFRKVKVKRTYQVIEEENQSCKPLKYLIYLQ